MLGSGDRRVVLFLETHVSGRKVDRCVLATDIDAEPWAHNHCFGSDRPGWLDGSPQSGVAHGFVLIPVSGVGKAVGVEKIGGHGVEGTFNKDMTNYEMPFEAHKQIVKPLSQTCTHIWRGQACAVRKSARVCAR